MAVQSAGGSWGINPATPKYGTTPYVNNDPNKVAANTPGGVQFNGGTGADDLLSQMKLLMGLAGGSGSQNGLYYGIYTPQEMAQRGLAMNGANRGAVDSQASYINQQAGNNTLQEQLGEQDLNSQGQQAMLQAEQDRHSAQGQFAANGSYSSEAARQALGGSNTSWNDYSQTPWNPDSRGDITRGRDNTMGGLLRQLAGMRGNYQTSQGGLMNQLQQLNPQYLGLDQGNDAYNRLLNGQYNTNVSPEMRALMSALSQAV